jgi:hypothetical protein
MEHISKSTTNTLQNLMVKCMLNPNNKDFYIGYLTTERVEQLLTTFSDEEFTEMFWSAFEIAQAKFIKELSSIESSFENACPVCCCTTYSFGAKCPNCDFEENC